MYKNYNELREIYKSKGTVMIPFEDQLNPLNKKDFENLFKYCEKVDKEFVEIGDAGESNNLLVGRFMTDKIKPEVEKNIYSEKVIKILSKDKFKKIIESTLNLNKYFYIRRVQYNQINKGNFVGYHLDIDSNPNYLAACVIQLGDNFGIYFFQIDIYFYLI